MLHTAAVLGTWILSCAAWLHMSIPSGNTTKSATTTLVHQLRGAKIYAAPGVIESLVVAVTSN